MPVAKLALATAVAYMMLIATIYFLPTMARWIISGGDIVADWVKSSAVVDDSVMILMDLLLDGKVFMIIPFLLIARILIEAVPFVLTKISWGRVIAGMMMLGIIIGGGYILVT